MHLCGAVHIASPSSSQSTAGPIVRVTPHELHIRDPRALDTVYPPGVYLDKERWERSFGEGGVLQTHHAAIHKRRRAALNPMYVAHSIMAGSKCLCPQSRGLLCKGPRDALCMQRPI